MDESILLREGLNLWIRGLGYFRRRHFRRMHFRRRNIGRMEHWSNGTLVEWNIGRMVRLGQVRLG